MEDMQGKFYQSLKRNYKEIKNDRATAIAEDAEIIYKRTVEDLETALKRMKREQDGMLDLSPSTRDSLVLANDFNAKEFVDKDIELGIRIRQTEIKLEVATGRYEYLFKGE